MNDPYAIADQPVRPGDKLLISITFPAHLDDSETCAAEIVLEDFLRSNSDTNWQPELYRVIRRKT